MSTTRRPSPRSNACASAIASSCGSKCPMPARPARPTASTGWSRRSSSTSAPPTSVRRDRAARQRGRAASARAQVLQLPAAAEGPHPDPGAVAAARLEGMGRLHLHGRIRRMARQGPRRAREHGQLRALGRRRHLLFRPRAAASRSRHRQPAVQHREPDRGLRHRRTAGPARPQVHLLPLPGRIYGSPEDPVRLRRRTNQASRHSALRARVFSQHLPHGLSPEGTLDARHRPTGLAAIRLAGSFATRYLLFRDRKGVFTSFVPIVAYALDRAVLGFLYRRRASAPRSCSSLRCSRPARG